MSSAAPRFLGWCSRFGAETHLLPASGAYGKLCWRFLPGSRKWRRGTVTALPVIERDALMMLRKWLVAVLLAVAVPAGARAEPGPCRPDAGGFLVCGSGPDALIVLEDTSSPDGKLAIGWRAKEEGPEGFPEAEDVENHIVRLTDGKELGLVVGRRWASSRGHANHIYLTAAWSPDGRWLLVGDGGKWALEAMAIYSVDQAAAASKGYGLFRAISAAAGRTLAARIGKTKAESYLLDIAGDQTITVANSGKVTIPMLFQIPKEDDRNIDIAVSFKARRTGGQVEISALSISQRKKR